MTEWMYRAVWPILNVDLPISKLRVEACGLIDAMAHADGARIVGDIRWTVDGEQLIAEAPAVPVTADEPAGPAGYGSVARQAERIAAMARRHIPDRHIAELLGCSESAVAKVRARRRIPPGVGTGPIPPVARVA